MFPFDVCYELTIFECMMIIIGIFLIIGIVVLVKIARDLRDTINTENDHSTTATNTITDALREFGDILVVQNTIDDESLVAAEQNRVKNTTTINENTAVLRELVKTNAETDRSTTAINENAINENTAVLRGIDEKLRGIDEKLADMSRTNKIDSQSNTDNSKLYIAAPYTENRILVQGVANFIYSDDPNKNNNNNDNNNNNNNNTVGQKGWSQLFSPKDGSTKSFINIGDDDYDDDDDDGQGYSDDESSDEDYDVCCDLTAGSHETEGHDHLRNNDVEDEVRDSGTSLIHNHTTTTTAAAAAAGLGRLVQTDNTELNEAYNQIRVLREDNNVVIQRSNEACNEISELREVVAHLQAENTGLRRAHSRNNFFHFC